jgi:rod shape-determining protein MreD
MERTSAFSSWKVLTNTIPVVLAIMGTLISNIPITFTGDHVPAPLLGLMPVYYFSLVRPDLMTPAWAFAIGLLEDLVAPGAPGVWAASFLATYAIVANQREAFASLSGFPAILGFATAALIAGGTQYILICLLNVHLYPVTPVMGELLTNVVLYVPFATLMGWVNFRFVGPARSEF